MKKATQKGFTLIELMIVIAIIGIIAAIAIPAYQDYIGRSQASEAPYIIDGLKTEMALSWAETGACPANNAGGWALATAYSGRYVAQIALATLAGAEVIPTGAVGVNVDAACSMTATYRADEVHRDLRGDTFVVWYGPRSTDSVSGADVWWCVQNGAGGTGGNVPVKFLPSACRQ